MNLDKLASKLSKDDAQLAVTMELLDEHKQTIKNTVTAASEFLLGSFLVFVAALLLLVVWIANL